MNSDEYRRLVRSAVRPPKLLKERLADRAKRKEKTVEVQEMLGQLLTSLSDDNGIIRLSKCALCSINKSGTRGTLLCTAGDTLLQLVVTLKTFERGELWQVMNNETGVFQYTDWMPVGTDLEAIEGAALRPTGEFQGMRAVALFVTNWNGRRVRTRAWVPLSSVPKRLLKLPAEQPKDPNWEEAKSTLSRLGLKPADVEDLYQLAITTEHDLQEASVEDCDALMLRLHAAKVIQRG